jgi:phage terminase large subunit-like protein
MLESPTFASYYPTVAQRSVGKYGNVRGWRRNRLWTASGFVLDAIGLDTAARGVKIDESRPDLIIFDDIDEDTDTEDATKKKVSILTKRIIPAGSADLAIVGVQNLIHPEGVFARLAGVAEAPADFMHRRIVSGPFPALRGLAWETYEKVDGSIGYKITSGEPVWEGQDLDVCQEMVDDMGLTAFLQECQQEVDIPENGLFAHVVFRHVRKTPDLVRTVCWVDPAITDTDNSDCQAISIAGIGANKKVYILYSWQQRASPQTAMRMAIKLGMYHNCDHIGVETDQGGDTWISVYNEAVRYMGIDPNRVPPFVSAKAGAGAGSKVHRANQLLTDYEKGMIMHVINKENTHELLEKMLRRFPVKKPFDLVDVTEWSRRKLRGTSSNIAMMPFVGNRIRVAV